MARRHVVSRRTGTKRETVWLQFAPTSTTLVSGTATGLFTLNAAALALRPFTIVRTRGLLSLASDQTAAAERQRVGFGISVVSDQASAIGITAVPTPITDMGSDLWLEYQLLYYEMDPTNSMGPQFQTYVIDSKAMRRVDISQDVFVSAEQGAAVGGVLQTGFRMLIKLH